jgi:hypothetical protein
VGEQNSCEAGAPSLPPGVSETLDAFKGTLDRELGLAERLTTKARQSFVLSIGFFTIVQTVAFNSFHSGFIRGLELTWLFALAIASIFFLTIAAFATLRSDVPLAFGEFDLDDLGRAMQKAYRGDVQVPGRLGETYHAMVTWMREDNDKRYRYYRYAVTAAGVSIVISTGELISSLAFRIPG